MAEISITMKVKVPKLTALDNFLGKQLVVYIVVAVVVVVVVDVIAPQLFFVWTKRCCCRVVRFH